MLRISHDRRAPRRALSLFAALALLILAVPVLAQAVPDAPPPDAPAPDAAVPGAPVAAPDVADAADVAEAALPPGVGDVRDAIRRFEAAAAAYQGEIRDTVLRKILRRGEFTKQSYEQQVARIEDEQNARRDEAIAAHERFVRHHPKHQQHTPDVMFRLGELYYERSAIQYARAEDEYGTLRDLWQRGKLPSEPPPPEQDFSPTIDTYALLLERFPTFRYADATLYLLAYCQENSMREMEAIDSYTLLVNRYPKSTYAPEAWLRIGEIRFDFGDFEKAAAAYAKILEHPESKFYDLALYKLAWAYFEAYSFDKAIRHFKDLIALYEEKREALGEKGAQLQQEAVEYLARSLSEDDWDGDGLADPGAGVERGLSYLRDGKPYEERILEAYAQSLYDLHERPKYEDAVRVYRTLMERHALSPKNPDLQAKIIDIYDILREPEKATAARAELASLFGPGSKWAAANEGRTDVITRADSMVEMALRQKAKYHHRHAQELKTEARTTDSPALLVEAEREYGAAAAAYETYLVRYPQGPYTYEMTFFWAESLYYSGRFDEAAEKYELVRDTAGKEEYLEYSAFSAIQSYEKGIEARVATGALPKDTLHKEPPAAAEETDPKGGRGEVRRVAPQAVPQPVLRWVAAIDAYVARGLTRPDDATAQSKLAYRAAEMYYTYDNYDEARRRFEDVIRRYPSEIVASYAAANIVNSYRRENDWENIERWARYIEENQIGKPEEQAALLEEIKYRKLGAQFQEATSLLAQKRHAEAAEEFERIVDENPDFEDADNAIYNAAIAYQEVKRYDSAARLMERIVTEERFKDSPLREAALFRLSENAKKFFDFDRAIAGYRALTDRYPKYAQASYALFQAAELEEYSGRLDDAVRDFRGYVDRYQGEREDVVPVFFRMALVYKKKGDEAAYHRALEEFLKRFGPRKEAGDLVLEAYVELASAARRNGQMDKARKYYQQVLKEYGARLMQPETPAAVFAAEAQFQLVEMDFVEYKKLQIRGSITQMGRQLRDKQEKLFALEQAYIAIFPYKAFDWTVAAYFRVGNIYQEFAKALYDAPEPPNLTDDEIDIYQTQIEDEGVKWENVAIERYEETIQQARRLKIVNEWTKRALEELAKYKPAEYRLFKEEKKLYRFDPLFGAPPPVVAAPVTAAEPVLDEAPVPVDAPPPAPPATDVGSAPSTTPEEPSATPDAAPTPSSEEVAP